AQRSARLVEGHRSGGRLQALEDDPGGGHGRVPAQVHLACRREPAKVVPLRGGYEEGGLREVVLRGDRLERGDVEPRLERADGRGVAGEGPIREDIDLEEAKFHGK